MLADPQSTSCTLDALSNDPTAPEIEYHEKLPMKSSQSSEGLQKCLRILERQLLMGHGALSRDLKHRSYRKNTSITDVIRCFLDNWSLFEAYVEYVQHLEIALRQVNGALKMEPSNQPTSVEILDKKTISQIRHLERLALQQSNAGFAASLLLPFERLLEYSAMFQGLLLHMDFSKVEPNSDTLQLALKLECIFRDIDKSGLRTIDRVNVPSLWPNSVGTINLEDGKPRPRLPPRPPDPRAFSITATVGTAPPSPTFAIRNDRDDHPFNSTDRSVRTWEYRDETDSIDTDRKAVTELSRQHGFIQVWNSRGPD
ncbi:hypothetical protein FRC03_003798 [Tulasnella sp. 419]|nr:hypothetical protein FRC03_003798 [Tulasnella sp. 419]